MFGGRHVYVTLSSRLGRTQGEHVLVNGLTDLIYAYVYMNGQTDDVRPASV